MTTARIIRWVILVGLLVLAILFSDRWPGMGASLTWPSAGSEVLQQTLSADRNASATTDMLQPNLVAPSSDFQVTLTVTQTAAVLAAQTLMINPSSFAVNFPTILR